MAYYCIGLGRDTLPVAMRIVETHDPEILRLDDDSFALKLFGFVIILFSVSIWPIYLQIEMANGNTPRLWRLALVLCASLFMAALGLMGMLCSGQTVIDRRLRKVVTWTRLLHWRQRRVIALKHFARVVVRRHSHRYRATWSVELRANVRSREKDVHCGMVDTETEAKQLAQRISTFFGIPFEQPLPLGQDRHRE